MKFTTVDQRRCETLVQMLSKATYKMEGLEVSAGHQVFAWVNTLLNKIKEEVQMDETEKKDLVERGVELAKEEEQKKERQKENDKAISKVKRLDEEKKDKEKEERLQLTKLMRKYKKTPPKETVKRKPPVKVVKKTKAKAKRKKR